MGRAATNVCTGAALLRDRVDARSDHRRVLRVLVDEYDDDEDVLQVQHAGVAVRLRPAAARPVPSLILQQYYAPGQAVYSGSRTGTDYGGSRLATLSQ